MNAPLLTFVATTASEQNGNRRPSRSVNCTRVFYSGDVLSIRLQWALSQKLFTEENLRSAHGGLCCLQPCRQRSCLNQIA